MRPALAAVALGLTLAIPLGAQSGAVALVVIDDASDVGLPDVQVSVAGSTTEGVTDVRGRFFYVVPKAGKVILLMRRLGYSPGTVTVDVAPGDTARVTFAMSVVAQTLSTVDVRDTLTSNSPLLRDFERRVATHAGSAAYITRTEIDKRRPSQTSDLLRRVSSIAIADSMGVIDGRVSPRPEACDAEGNAGPRELSASGGHRRAAQGVGIRRELDSAERDPRHRDLPGPVDHPRRVREHGPRRRVRADPHLDSARQVAGSSPRTAYT